MKEVFERWTKQSRGRKSKEVEVEEEEEEEEDPCRLWRCTQVPSVLRHQQAIQHEQHCRLQSPHKLATRLLRHFPFLFIRYVGTNCYELHDMPSDNNIAAGQ
eukprot:645667-Hanusia_phi.AAC.1